MRVRACKTPSAQTRTFQSPSRHRTPTLSSRGLRPVRRTGVNCSRTPPPTLHPYLKDFPKARRSSYTGLAPEDILAKRWNCTPKRGRPPDKDHNDDEGDQASSSLTPPASCSTCNTGARPTIHQLLWECIGLQQVRAQHVAPDQGVR